MTIKGYTQIGLSTGLAIFLYHLFLIKFGLQQSGWLGLQYILLLLGIFISIFLYNRANKLVILDLFMIGIRTMSSAIIILVLGVVFFHFLKPGNEKITYTIMMVVFPFGMSGALSSFVSAIIVNKLLQKT